MVARRGAGALEDFKAALQSTVGTGQGGCRGALRALCAGGARQGSGLGSLPEQEEPRCLLVAGHQDAAVHSANF